MSGSQKKKAAKQEFTEQLFDCVDVPRLRRVMIEHGHSVPDDIDSDVAAALRILASKYRQEVGRKAKSTPKKLSEMGKALRPVLSGDSFIDEVFMQRWYVIPSNDVGFIRAWKEDIYAPTTSVEWIDETELASVIERTINEGVVVPTALIEQRIPRTIRFRRGTYANTIFEFRTEGAIVTLDSSPKPIRRSSRKISVPTEALSAAMLLLRQAGTDTTLVGYQPEGYLTLANGSAFVAFSEWTKAMGPLPSRKK